MNRFASTPFTRKDLVVVMVVIGCMLTLLSACMQASREAARRACCNNQLKQIGLALHNYAQANRVFPPGTICDGAPTAPSNQYDVLAEAAQAGPRHQGTSFLLRILPYVEEDIVFKNWTWGVGICDNTKVPPSSSTNYTLANTDIHGFYCPTRRVQLRPGVDNAMMVSPGWTGGGTDYGACAGRHAAFTLATGYNLCDATMYYAPNFYPVPFKSQIDDTAAKRWGIFGRVNVATKFQEISDGSANTIMTGELQRITDQNLTSKDGWAIGGPATLFTTGAMVARQGATLANVVPPAAGNLMGNGFFGSPGSEHVDGANFGMADGSMHFISDSMDPNVFALLGSMADGSP